MSDDIKKLIALIRLNADERLYPVADALEALAAERDWLKAHAALLRDVIANHRIGYPGAPGGLLLGSVHADKILSALHDAGYAVVPATDPAPAVCEWDSRTTVFPMPTCNPAAALLNRIHRDGDMCPLCCKPIKFTEAKE